MPPPPFRAACATSNLNALHPFVSLSGAEHLTVDVLFVMWQA